MSTTHVTHAAAVAHVVTDSGSTTAVPALDVNLSTRAADATLSGMSAKLPASLGAKARAESLSVALSTEDATKIPALVTGRVPVDGSGVTQPVSGTVTANIGTTNGLALDATLTGGTQKAITRGGAKGSTTAADITSTAEGADHQAADVQIYHGGVAVNPTQIRALTSADIVNAVGSGGAALALEGGGNLAAAKASLDSLVAAIGFGDPSFEVSRTSLWRTKAGACINIIGRRASFTANVQNDLVMFTPSAGSSTTINEMAGTETLEIISSSASDTAAGTGVRTVKITYIDALGTVGAQNTTTVTLNGTTAVSLGAVRALAIQWAEVATVGSGGVAAGDITIRANATPTNLYELISAGGNRSMSGRYMVPVGMSAYANEWQGSAVNQDMDIRLRGTVEMATRASVTPYLFQDAMYPPSGTVSPSRVLPWLKFPAGSKLKLSAILTAVGGSPRCEGSISLVVITN
jgi:hypothetical protein